jgi:hypothetical protein
LKDGMDVMRENLLCGISIAFEGGDEKAQHKTLKQTNFNSNGEQAPLRRLYGLPHVEFIGTWHHQSLCNRLTLLYPPDDVSRKSVLRYFSLAYRSSPHRHACLMNGFSAPRHKIMPPAKVRAFIDKAVSARLGKPTQALNVPRGQLYAIGNVLLAIIIVGTAARPKIKELAGEARHGDLAGIVVLKLDKAALTTPIAKSFPLFHGHFIQAFCLPKRLGRSGGLGHIICKGV